MTSPKPRYAIYYAPAHDGALWQFGSGVIGYDAATGRDLPLTEIDGLSLESQRALTEEPRRYGFHATLKAPFHLTEGRDESELLAMAANFAAQQQQVPAFGLKTTLLSRFIALVPLEAEETISGLAAATVEAFEPFRAPLSEADIARRNPAALSPRQAANLARWGYPYVFEDFRFHMTLTGALPAELQQPVLEGLRAMFQNAVADQSTALDRITLFRQERRDGAFTIMRSFPLVAHLGLRS